MSVGYEPRRQKIGEVGRIWTMKDFVCYTKMFRFILQELGASRGYYRVRLENNMIVHELFFFKVCLTAVWRIKFGTQKMKTRYLDRNLLPKYMKC